MTADEYSLRHALVLNYAYNALLSTKGLEDTETATITLALNVPELCTCLPYLLSKGIN